MTTEDQVRLLERKLDQARALVMDLVLALSWYACTPNSRARAALDRNGLSDE